MKKHWQIDPPAPANLIAELHDYPPLLVQLLYNRGIVGHEAADAFLAEDPPLGNPFQIKGMNAAVDRLRRAIRAQEKIAVYGDFDADGVTATALLHQTLAALGAPVRPYIPHRVDEGYGLNSAALRLLKSDGARVVVTVDCGVRSVKEVAYGTQLGLDMIITDHHSLGDELPCAYAVINPKQTDDRYPYKEFSGAGLAFKLAQALLRVEKSTPLDRTRTPIGDETLLDLAALGTVADLVPLTGENRALVKKGLARLAKTDRAGLRALFQTMKMPPERVDAGTIGYFIGPRLNAAGRIKHAMAAFELLTTLSENDARSLATEIEDTNRTRQQLTDAMGNQAREAVLPTVDSEFLLFVSAPEFREGVIGLVASKLQEEFYRPAIAVHWGEHECRGSARSIPEFNIVAALDECRDLLVRHGGHAAAAGFTVLTGHLDRLRARLQEIAARELGTLVLTPTLHVDAPVNLGEANWDTYTLVQKLAPFGYGNRAPTFLARGVTVKDARIVGQNHLKLVLHDGKITWDAIAFRQGEWKSALENLPKRIDVVFHLEANEWNGQKRLQLDVKDMRVTGGE